jgi:peptide/nickel transport system permease protein
MKTAIKGAATLTSLFAFRTLLAVAKAIPTILGIVVLCFLFLQLVPGDAADALAAQSGSATDETMAAIRVRFGLDQPILTQLANYLNNLAHLNLGISTRYGEPVTKLILERLPNTIALMVVALALALAVGIVVGAVMAANAGRWVDQMLSFVVLVLYSTPGFWIGLMAIILFSAELGWLPDNGSATLGVELHGWSFFVDRARHLIMPAIAMSSFFVAVYARLMRATLLEVQVQDYIRTAVAKGLGPFAIYRRHAVRNALIPVTTMAGLHVGNLLGGAIVVETVFGWNGMGRLAVEAVDGRDFSLLLGVLLLSAFLVIVVNYAVDLIQALLDPRIRDQI